MQLLLVILARPCRNVPSTVIQEGKRGGGAAAAAWQHAAYSGSWLQNAMREMTLNVTM